MNNKSHKEVTVNEDTYYRMHYISEMMVDEDVFGRHTNSPSFDKVLNEILDYYEEDTLQDE
jgi:hypothetical protein